MTHRDNLDPLRGLAAAAVLAHHYKAYAGLSLPWISDVGGLLGVQMFFVLSGYLIAASAARHDWRTYLVRRAFRIYPAYWVALVGVGIFVSGVSYWPIPEDWPDRLLNFLALGHLTPAALRHDVLTVSWTLTSEWAWYLSAPVLVALAARCASGRVGRHFWAIALAVGVVVAVAWVWAAQRHLLDPLYAAQMRRVGADPITDFMRFAYISNAPPAQYVFFLLGAAAHRYEAALARLPAWLLAGAVLLFVGPAVHWNALLGLAPSPASGIGLTAFLILLLRAPTVTWRWPHALGEMAYPIYLLHVPVIIVVFNRLHWQGAAGLLASLAALLALSAALHRWVERPMNEFGRRLPLGKALARPHG